MLSSAPPQCLIPPRNAAVRPPRVAVLAAPRGRRVQPPNPDWSSGEASETEEEGDPNGAPLRGWDVLHALHRAATKKGGAARKGKKRKPPEAKREELVDVQDVKPIQVKNDWEGRIDELERKLQDLRTRYHY